MIDFFGDCFSSRWRWIFCSGLEEEEDGYGELSHSVHSNSFQLLFSSLTQVLLYSFIAVTVVVVVVVTSGVWVATVVGYSVFLLVS